jgi:hypothetical protein
VSIDGAGTGTGSLAITTGSAAGARALKVVSGGDTSLTPITVLGAPTSATNVSTAPAGTVVTVTGTNWDPNQSVTVRSTQSGPPFPPPSTTDPAVTATADAAGAISTSYTVTDLSTAYIGGSRVHVAGPPPTVIFGSTPMTVTKPVVPPSVFTVTKAGSIKGKLVVGKKLTAKAPVTSPVGTVTYQWFRGSKAIKKATKKSYTLTSKDKGKKIKVVMTMSHTNYTTLVATVKAKGKVAEAN